ncbi:protein-tyrosine-phosphatase [Erythrobacter sp. 3-20A1M]|uniref:tyrosine-protein phosphatase n=1 Tax=Erythrobacter sp. 3-20A1M TaxID=2653850 RepID=UPI001BFC8607|nr:tyrosine-protein phosphatase [Erythrobacter sp. 3-20A1M]QWC57886.1 protein-tyrosine-phosphatase [Erythrobacter sp. 3-20A1M]
MSAGRLLALEHVHNFRDYGGYAVPDGRLKRGALFRSGHHADASGSDLDVIGGLGLAHVLDLRGNRERESYPSRAFRGFAGEVIYYDGETAGLAPHAEAADGVLTEADAHRAMERLYTRLPERAALLWTVRRYFAALADGKGASLIHCHAGKDRTGMAVALLHHALGVHHDDIMEDYLLTNSAGNDEARIAQGAVAIRRRYGDASDEAIRALMGVRANYLEAAWRALEQSHGSVDAFLAAELGVDDALRERLRLHLVESSPT